MTPREETIAVGPTRVEVLIGGAGDPLLVLHGAGGNRGWLRWIERPSPREAKQDSANGGERADPPNGGMTP